MASRGVQRSLGSSPLLLLLLFFALATVSSTTEKNEDSEDDSFSNPQMLSAYDKTEYISIGLPFVENQRSDFDFDTAEPSGNGSLFLSTSEHTLPKQSTDLVDDYVTSVTSSAPKRIPLQSDISTMYRRYPYMPKISNVTQVDITASPLSIVNFTRRYKREDQSACAKFEEGDPVKREFYSPNYPEPYPKNTSCFRVLEADPGMVLKVEFRDSFELEDQEKCEYDYLEVRDGKYGYSRPIGNFCRPFPFPEITSSSRYLWLRFRSDNSIQGNGFRAVYSMIPRPPVKTPETDECMLNVTGHMEYLIETSEIAEQKKLAAEQGTELDCVWNITVPESYKVQLTFPVFRLDKPNECDINFVQVYDKDPTTVNNPAIINNFCGSIADLVTSKGNEAYLRFFATKAAMNSTFGALMTAIREKEGNKDKGCKDDEFDCQDACISDTLRCNNRVNCRYRFDEDPDICSTEKTGLNMNSEHVIIILIVFTILMSGLCFTCIFNCCKKLIHDHRIIKEHLRQSRERKLDELGRKATPCSIAEAYTELGSNGHHRHGSESPSLEVLANPKELVSPMTIIEREYMRERSIGLSVDLSDIHQSNNVSNATQERLQESSEERETRDMACQTRESIFDAGFVLKPTAHPAFTTFGFQTSPQPSGSRKQSLEYHPTHHYHHHAHSHSHQPKPSAYHQHQPHQHQHQSQQHHEPHAHQSAHHRQIGWPSSEAAAASIEPSSSPLTSRRCSVCHPSSAEPTPRLCLRHSSTPIVPAPHGWSAHESTYSPEELATLQLLQQSPTGHSPPSEPASGPSARPSPKFSATRLKAAGSGENYGFLYSADERETSELSQRQQHSQHTASSGSSSQRSGAKPVKCPQVLDSRFKTEAVIEVDQKRPFSIESTKSAPDVIATH